MTDHSSLLDTLAKAPPPPSELDELISRDPLDLSAQDIDSIIAYQRQQRARREAGGKGKRAAPDIAGKLDLAQLIQASAPAAPKISPPASGGFRRL